MKTEIMNEFMQIKVVEGKTLQEHFCIQTTRSDAHDIIDRLLNIDGILTINNGTNVYAVNKKFVSCWIEEEGSITIYLA